MLIVFLKEIFYLTALQYTEFFTSLLLLSKLKIIMSKLAWKIIDNLNPNQIDDLCQMYQQEWWSKGRKIEDVKKMLRCSDIIVALCEPKSYRLIAFARILTDFTYRGFILDVIVASAYRRQGLGRILLETTNNHPQLQAVESLILFCHPEMVDFYQKWGFSESPEDIRLMFGNTVLESR